MNTSANRLTQADIDRLPISRRSGRVCRCLAWLDGCPGGVMTVCLLLSFILGAWGLWLIWSAGEAIRTAAR